MALLLAQSGFAQLTKSQQNYIIKKVERAQKEAQRQQQKQLDEQRRHDQAVAKSQQENYVNQQVAQQLWSENKPEDYINPDPNQNPGYHAFTNYNDKIQQENRVAVLEDPKNADPANLGQKDLTDEESQAWVSQKWGLIEQNDKGIPWKEHADKAWEAFVPKANKALCRNVPNHLKCLGGSRKIPTTSTPTAQPQGAQVRYAATSGQSQPVAGQKPSRANKKKGYTPQPQVPRYAERIQPRPQPAPMGQVDMMFGKPQTKSTTKTRSNGGTKFRSPKQAPKANNGQGNSEMVNNGSRSKNAGRTTSANPKNGRGQSGNSSSNVQTTVNNQTQRNKGTGNNGSQQSVKQQAPKSQTSTSGANATGSKMDQQAPKLTISLGSAQKNKDAVNTKSAMTAQRKLNAMPLLVKDGKHLQVKSISAIKKEIYK